MREVCSTALSSRSSRGDPTGGNAESMVGLFNTTGVTPVGFTTDAVTTLSHALTKLQTIGEIPNAWILNPLDAEGVDLLRWTATVAVF